MAVKKYPVYGDEGAEVLKYQKLLKKQGSTIQLNKKFSIGMMSAIRSFQKKMNLKITGKIDAATAKALGAETAAKKTAK